MNTKLVFCCFNADEMGHVPQIKRSLQAAGNFFPCLNVPNGVDVAERLKLSSSLGTNIIPEVGEEKEKKEP
jgi:hypothetical protein